MTEVHKVAAYVPVSASMVADAACLSDAIEDAMWRPWKRPHRNPMPTFVLFARLDRAQHAIAEARRRMAGARDVLRYGIYDHEEAS